MIELFRNRYITRTIIAAATVTACTFALPANAQTTDNTGTGTAAVDTDDDDDGDFDEWGLLGLLGLAGLFGLKRRDDDRHVRTTTTHGDPRV